MQFLLFQAYCKHKAEIAENDQKNQKNAEAVLKKTYEKAWKTFSASSTHANILKRKYINE